MPPQSLIGRFDVANVVTMNLPIGRVSYQFQGMHSLSIIQTSSQDVILSSFELKFWLEGSCQTNDGDWRHHQQKRKKLVLPGGVHQTRGSLQGQINGDGP